MIVLDIGATKVACVVAKQGAVLGTGVVDYPALRASWPSDAQMIGQMLERAVAATGVEVARGRVAVAFSHPELSHARVTASIDLAEEPVPVRARDLSRLRQQAISQALGIDRDVLMLEPLGYRGNGFDHVRDPRTLLTTRLTGTFALVSVPLAVCQLIRQAVEAAGLEMDRLLYSAHALAVACDDPDAAGRGTDESARSLLLDLGGCSADCVVWERGHLVRALTVPWGGMQVAEAIAGRCRTTLEHARAISLQGFSSPKAEVAAIWRKQARAFADGLRQVLDGEPLPSRAFVTGRGALVDGMVEWVQETTGIPAKLGRSPRSKSFGDVGQQVALSAALGALDVMSASSPVVRPQPSRLVDRLLVGTKALLTEYF